MWIFPKSRKPSQVTSDRWRLNGEDARNPYTARRPRPVRRKLFGQILGILLDNAVKYCDEKGRVQVEVTTEKKKKVLR